MRFRFCASLRRTRFLLPFCFPGSDPTSVAAVSWLPSYFFSQHFVPFKPQVPIGFMCRSPRKGTHVPPALRQPTTSLGSAKPKKEIRQATTVSEIKVPRPRPLEQPPPCRRHSSMTLRDEAASAGSRVRTEAGTSTSQALRPGRVPRGLRRVRVGAAPWRCEPSARPRGPGVHTQASGLRIGNSRQVSVCVVFVFQII